MRPAKVFAIADLHLGHANILHFESERRPFATIEEHNQTLVANWNSVVRPQDTVWLLGDVVFGMSNVHYLNQLNGRIKLVLGNHDRFDSNVYLKNNIRQLYGVGSVTRRATEKRGALNLVLTHIPVHENQFSRYHLNIHGHLHSKKLPDPRYINVSCEQINLTPVEIDSLI